MNSIETLITEISLKSKFREKFPKRLKARRIEPMRGTRKIAIDMNGTKFDNPSGGSYGDYMDDYTASDLQRDITRGSGTKASDFVASLAAKYGLEIYGFADVLPSVIYLTPKSDVVSLSTIEKIASEIGRVASEPDRKQKRGVRYDNYILQHTKDINLTK